MICRRPYFRIGRSGHPVLLLLFALAGSARPGRAAEYVSGSQARQSTKVESGLFIHLGCGDGRLVLEMAASGKFLAHGLGRDRALVERGRRTIREKGLYGQASLDHWTHGYLPYASNLVDLLVAGELGRVPREEVMRVLCPGGAAYLKLDGQWTVLSKTRPKEMGEWNHARCGANGNPVSSDTYLSVPKRIRWIGMGLGRNALSADGRVYYGGVTVANGYNGLPLWSQGLRMMVASDNRVFGLSGNVLTALDGATGKMVTQYPAAGRPGTVLSVREGIDKKPTLVTSDGKAVRVIDPGSGRLCWTHEADGVRALVAGEGKVIFLKGKQGAGKTAVCLDLADGKLLWSKDHDWAAKSRSCSFRYGVVAYELSSGGDSGQGNAIHAVSAQSGEALWSHAYDPGMIHGKRTRALFAQDLLWIQPGRGCAALDPLTGKQKKRGASGWGHCWTPIATERYLIAGELNFTELATGRHEGNRITKASCGRGFLPSNGLLYGFGSGCICFPMLKGTMALAGDEAPLPEASGAPRLERGAAFGVALPRAETEPESEWPTYRHNVWRSGCSDAPAPAALQRIWETQIETAPQVPLLDRWKKNPLAANPITAPTVAQGLVFVGTLDTHRLMALDARTGKPRWSFIANGRIDTPPTIHEGLCLFGTRSGWAYCLTAATGELVWRFRAGPEDRRIVAYGQLESAWPVPGTVLVSKGVAYFAGGRHPLADGGIYVYALEPRTGRMLAEIPVSRLPMPRWYGRLGNDFDTSDILVRDGDSIAMGRWKLDPATGKGRWDRTSGFFTARKTGVLVLRGLWSYAQDPPNSRGRRRRPPMVFNDDTLFVAGGDLYATKLETMESLKGKDAQYREPKGATGDYKVAWTPYSLMSGFKKIWSSNEGRGATALALAGDTLFAADKNGTVRAVSVAGGKKTGEISVGAKPVWDGMAVAYGRLYLCTMDGKVVCLGDPASPVPAPPSLTKVASAKPTAAPKPKPPEPSKPTGPKPPAKPSASEAEWAARLLAQLRADTKAGRHPRFRLESMGQYFKVLSVGEEGQLNIATGPVSLSYQWSRLTAGDRARLAAAAARDENPESCCLAAYFLLKAGQKERAEDFLLKIKDKQKIEEVRAAGR